MKILIVKIKNNLTKNDQDLVDNVYKPCKDNNNPRGF